jgi:alkylhydroperoxidase family enzyme
MGVPASIGDLPVSQVAGLTRLELAESMTRIGDGARVDDEVWTAAGGVFSDEEISALLYLIGLINVWNRTNIAVQLPGDYVLPGT